MKADSSSIAHSDHDRPVRASRLVRRAVAIPTAAFALGLLLGGCDTGGSSAAEPTAPRASEASSFDRTGPQHGDEAGVLAVSAAWDAAWNAGNASGLAATFAEEGEFINGRGQIAVGAAAIGAQHAISLAGPFHGSHTVGHVRRITFLSGTTAVLDVDNELTGWAFLPPGVISTEPNVNRGRHRRVLVKRGGEWRVLLMQITTVARAQ